MHDLKTNFDKIYPIINQTLTEHLDEAGNLQSYPNKPAFPDVHIIALSLLQEALSIDSESFGFGVKCRGTTPLISPRFFI